eukprot:gnl/MRDRNA2_/MRDRNA2_157957_c0_seq1.p1 gnl/MRDRNA2_/MRDRNA2_157957_c0~~gnl/MRDRNA2_/MRDRNA2_157957_c0_seq1.p1  ORF type:complete len:433 (+),score=62.42 gnl/MRDRNA2_/MRDRNA2_157957_c0_seq1:77-1375(+)
MPSLCVGLLLGLLLGYVQVQDAHARAATLPVWMSPKETPGLDSDLTAEQRITVSQYDPGVEGSKTAVGSASTGFEERLIHEGSKPLKGMKVLGPKQWSKMHNIRIINETVFDYYGTQVVLTEHGIQPATQYVYTADYTLQMRPRRVALFIIDVMIDYIPFVGYLIPEIKPLLEAFRARGLPVFWSNWLRRANDGLYGALDRFYGPTGVKSQMNPMYVYAPNGGQTVPELAPTEKEKDLGRVFKSTHLNKFFDVDPHTGKSFLAEQMQKMGVDTLVLVGSWTEDCVIGTVSSAVDHYNLDVVLVNKAVGTATPDHYPGMELMHSASTKVVSKAEILEYIANEPLEQLWESRSGLPSLGNLDEISLRPQEDKQLVNTNLGIEAIATTPANSLLSSHAPVVTALFVGIIIGALLHAAAMRGIIKHPKRMTHPLLE